MEFSEAELRVLREQGIAIFRGKVILEAQPPVTREHLDRIRGMVDGELPDGLLELWKTAFGGALDYDLQLDFGGRQFTTSFVELFYIGSDHYHDLVGWMEHERDLSAEEDEEPTADLPVVPFGGFEYLERVYCVVQERDFGSIHYWAQGLPPAWKMRLTDDSLVRVASSVGELFDLLSLEEDPFRDSPGEYERGEEMRSAVDSLANVDLGLAEKLKGLIQSSVFDWRGILQDTASAEELSQAQARALPLGLRHAADHDDAQLVGEILACGYPIDVPLQDASSIVPYCLLKRAFKLTELAIGSGVALSLDPIIYAANAPLSLLQALVERGFPFDVEAPLSVAEAGDVDGALYLAGAASRANEGEWADLKKKARGRQLRRAEDAASVKAGTLGSDLSPEDYLRQAESLREFSERLPRKKVFGIF